MAVFTKKIIQIDQQQTPIMSGDNVSYMQVENLFYAEFECDTTADLPDQVKTVDTATVKGTITLVVGSKAHVIDTNKEYKLKSDGTWVEQNEAARSDVYTTGQVNDLLQDMADAQANVDLAQDADINANTDAIKALVDNPEPKNVLNLLSATTQTIGGITFTVNPDFSITMEGSNTSGSAVFFSIPVVIQPGQYYFSGMPEAGGSSSYRLELRRPTATGTVSITCEGTSPVSWAPTEEYTGYFNIRVAAGYNFGNYETRTVKPMIDLRWKHNISSEYVPYVPSNMELYKMINP